MGSWYKTCGLSNMHIRDDDEVMVFVLEKNNDQTDRCYSTAFWSPCLLPFYSKYGDYGRGADDSGVTLPYLMAGIKEQLIEMELGDNEYHDIEIKRDKFDIELFYEAVHEGRLFKSDWRGDKQMIDFVMIRKDIADDILANFQREQYVGHGEGDCGYDNSYKLVTFAKILEDLPEFMAKLSEFLAPEEGLDDKANDALLRMKFMGGLSTVFKYEDSNLVGKWIRGDGYRFSRLAEPNEIVIDLMQAGKVKEATEVMVELLKGNYITSFMEMTRRNWSPAGHEGSQCNETHGYRIMAEATLRAIDRERKKYLEEVDDEYSEFN
jgi:hypothetical protein